MERDGARGSWMVLMVEEPLLQGHGLPNCLTLCQSDQGIITLGAPMTRHGYKSQPH